MNLTPDLLFQAILSLGVLFLATTKAVLSLKASRQKTAVGMQPVDVLLGVLFCGLMAVMSLQVTQQTPPSSTVSTERSGWAAAGDLLLGNLLMNGALLALIWAWFVQLRRQSLTSLFGLREHGLVPVVTKAVVFLVPAYLLAMGLNWVSVTLLQHWGFETPIQGAVKGLLGENGRAMQVVHLLLAVVMAPLLEEVLFRGLFFGSLRTIFPVPVAVVLSGIVFGAIHMNSPAFLSLVALGMAFAAAYQISRSLWVPVAMHMLFNLSQSLDAIWQGSHALP